MKDGTSLPGQRRHKKQLKIKILVERWKIFRKFPTVIKIKLTNFQKKVSSVLKDAMSFRKNLGIGIPILGEKFIHFLLITVRNISLK